MVLLFLLRAVFYVFIKGVHPRYQNQNTSPKSITGKHLYDNDIWSEVSLILQTLRLPRMVNNEGDSTMSWHFHQLLIVVKPCWYSMALSSLRIKEYIHVINDILNYFCLRNIKCKGWMFPKIFKVGSSVGRFTSINPFIVDINSFREIINSTLEVLQTNTAWHPASISWFVHFNLTRFLVVTKWAIELCV